jgi:phosphoribosylglycinamide formyltransferase-1
MINIAVFASGSGSNAENLVRYFSAHPDIRVHLIVTNKATAPVLERAKRLNVPSVYFDNESWKDPKVILSTLRQYEIDFVVLAGFLKLVSQGIIEAFPGKIINIHPALLPKYGGKGMYGNFVHETVHKNKEAETGITIHFVNEAYDEGKTIFQKSAKLIPGVDTPATIAEKIHALEYEYFPKVVEEVIMGSMDLEK